MPKFLSRKEVYRLLQRESPEDVYPDGAPSAYYSTAEMDAVASGIADTYENMRLIYENNFPISATGRISDWEITAFGKRLPASLTLSERQDRVEQKVRARKGLTVSDMKDIVKSVIGTDKLVEIAEDNGIRLILTGPDHWEGVPGYWKPDRFAGRAASKALEHFWTVVAQRYRGEPAIFAWDLLNEPHMPWFMEQWRGQWNDWLQNTYTDIKELKTTWGDELTDNDEWGDIKVPENRPDSANPRLRDFQRFRESLADEWVCSQVEAIRRFDPAHLVTVGYIQWSYPLVRPGNPNRYAAFNPHRQVRWLDFITIHFYPTLGSPFESSENRSGK